MILKDKLEKVTDRICLTSDLWSSIKKVLDCALAYRRAYARLSLVDSRQGWI
ncbi:hypothetical protein Hanom_Chr13g01216591 [Helianthus anomalus]